MSKNAKRECLRIINDLNIAGMLEHMDHEQLDRYWGKLNFFIDKFPQLEEKTKDALDKGDDKAFASALSYIQDILTEIHADTLAKECQSQIVAMTTEQFRPEKLKAYVIYLLSNISILSIDVQMAAMQIKNKAKEQTDKNTGMLSEKITVVGDKNKKTKNILAVDDQEIHLSALKSQLSGTPYQLTCFSSSEEALQFLKTSADFPDLFILDIMMPKIDGYQLAQQIKEARHGQLRNIPIIFITGNSEREAITRAYEAGGNGFIVKPYTKERVLEMISKFIYPLLN